MRRRAECRCPQHRVRHARWGSIRTVPASLRACLVCNPVAWANSFRAFALPALLPNATPARLAHSRRQQSTTLRRVILALNTVMWESPLWAVARQPPRHRVWHAPQGRMKTLATNATSCAPCTGPCALQGCFWTVCATPRHRQPAQLSVRLARSRLGPTPSRRALPAQLAHSSRCLARRRARQCPVIQTHCMATADRT